MLDQTWANPFELINVIDLEATCWKNHSEIPEGQEHEIIEIGITVVDRKTLKIVSTESMIVTPTRSTISAFCTELTTLTPEYVAAMGIPLEAAINKLKTDYHSSTRMFASFGDYDWKMLSSQLGRLGIEGILPPEDQRLNIKTWFAEKMGIKKPIGMNRALNRLRIPLEGTHHRGSDDSRNIAKILIALLPELQIPAQEVPSAGGGAASSSSTHSESETKSPHPSHL
jgi:inhibitor of KinA sporulation pathway (predicted exonuclease)